MNTPVRVYLEVGNKRTFACAPDWPGWCRSGRDEKQALQALVDYGTRYAKALRAAGLDFQAPAEVSEVTVTERLKGNTTTDFGAPAIAPSTDARSVDDTEFERFQTLLRACWNAFDAAVNKARGKQLRLGPRGGGRNLEKIIQHLLEADSAYLSQVSWKFDPGKSTSAYEALSRVNDEVLNALAAKAHGELPESGSRGGKRWTLRYFVRRLAWHILDHAWEIEDRIQ